MPYVPIEWLREHVDVPAGLSAEQLAAGLVPVGLGGGPGGGGGGDCPA